MRLLFGLVLIAGVGLAGFAVYMARGYIGSYQSELANARAASAQVVKTTEVFVSKKPLRYGQKLTKDDIRPVRWPVDAIPEGTFPSFDAIFPQGPDVHRVVLRAMEPGEAIMAVKVTEPGEDAGVGSRLAKGMRAFAIKVDVSSGVSGFLRPGDRVDIYWTGQTVSPDGRAGGNLTRLIETSVRLIAIDQTADGDRNSPAIARTVTVEITPRQVAALAQAQATGRLSLALVGADDETEAGFVEIDRKDLLGIEEQQIVQTEAKKICTIKTRKGAETITTEVACPEESQ